MIRLTGWHLSAHEGSCNGCTNKSETVYLLSFRSVTVRLCPRCIRDVATMTHAQVQAIKQEEWDAVYHAFTGE